MCDIKPVVTYKSLNGLYYESLDECRRHNKVFKAEASRKKFSEYLCNLMTLNPQQNCWLNGAGRIWSDKMAIVFNLSANWKELRDVLNKLEDV